MAPERADKATTEEKRFSTHSKKLGSVFSLTLETESLISSPKREGTAMLSAEPSQQVQYLTGSLNLSFPKPVHLLHNMMKQMPDRPLIKMSAKAGT